MVSSHRDVNFIDLDNDKLLLIACDSCGGIGLKENDIVQSPNNITGGFTARVCLMEILSLGAKPVGLTINICNEPSPTGDEMLLGIKKELENIDLDIPITISTEKNIKTSMTALGVTAMGIVSKKNLLINKVAEGDFIYAAGIPSVGNETIENIKLISDATHIKEILKNQNVKEIIPVGSSGIKGELDKLSTSYDLTIDYIQDTVLDLNKTAGPSTAIIIITKDPLQLKLGIPITFIGKIK